MNKAKIFLIGVVLVITAPLTLSIYTFWLLAEFIMFVGEAFVHRNDPIVISDEAMGRSI